jgi:hypothetical protein
VQGHALLPGPDSKFDAKTDRALYHNRKDHRLRSRLGAPSGVGAPTTSRRVILEGPSLWRASSVPIRHQFDWYREQS